MNSKVSRDMGRAKIVVILNDEENFFISFGKGLKSLIILILRNYMQIYFVFV